MLLSAWSNECILFGMSLTVLVRRIALVAVLCLLSIGHGLTELRADLLASCGNQVACGSFADFQQRYPLCFLDPVCVSPLFELNGTTQDWGGPVWALGWEGRPPSALTALALPNLVLVIALCASVGLLLGAAAASVGRRTVSLCALWLTLLVLCEAIRWFIALRDFDLLAAGATGREPVAAAALLAEIVVATVVIALVSWTTHGAARRWASRQDPFMHAGA